MLEYLDTIDSDSDFIPESDTDDISEEEYATHAISPAAHPVSEMTRMMNTTGKFCHLSSLSRFLYSSKKCLDLRIFILFILLLLLTSISTDMILTLTVTESNRYAQQVTSM
jgi:hypothetical protein